MGSQKADDGGLREILTKQLLQDFETSGEAREDFDLLSLVNSNVVDYGKPGSDTRRLVQRRWNLIKQKKIGAYKQYLEKRQAVPGPRAKAEFILYLGDKSSPNSTAMAAKDEEWSEEDSPPRTPPTKENRKARPPHSSQGSDDASFPGSATSGRRDSRPFSPGWAPTPRLTPTPQLATSSPAPCVTNPHVFRATSLLGASDSSIGNGGLSWSKFQDGARRNPWIVNIDALHPERNL